MAAFTEVPTIFSDKAPLTLAVPPPGHRAAQLRSALDICRGAARLLKAHGLAVITELALASDRRADIAGVAASGEIWIVEVKSCLADFRGDQKWPEYREFCDRFFFAVGPDFPREVLPQDAGLIIADRYGGEIIRAASEHKLAGARRKAMTLRMLRAAAFRLQATVDPEGGWGAVYVDELLPPAVLLSHDAEIVFGVLVAVLSLNDIAAPRRILRHGRVALIVVAGVLRRVAPLTGRANAGRALIGRAMALRSRAAIAPV